MRLQPAKADYKPHAVSSAQLMARFRFFTVESNTSTLPGWYSHALQAQFAKHHSRCDCVTPTRNIKIPLGAAWLNEAQLPYAHKRSWLSSRALTQEGRHGLVWALRDPLRSLLGSCLGSSLPCRAFLHHPSSAATYEHHARLSSTKRK